MRYMRVIPKDEFVTRMLADQQLRKEKRIDAAHAYAGYRAARSQKIEHRIAMKQKRKG